MEIDRESLARYGDLGVILSYQGKADDVLRLIARIEQRFDVTSELNFAIDAAFRANKIQIPFPQRDLHVRSWAEEARMASEGPAGRGKVRELVRRRASGNDVSPPSGVQDEVEDT